jgi:hypothetical protein
MALPSARDLSRTLLAFFVRGSPWGIAACGLYLLGVPAFTALVAVFGFSFLVGFCNAAADDIGGKR